MGFALLRDATKMNSVGPRYRIVLVNLVKEAFRSRSPNYGLAYLAAYYKSHGRHTDDVKFILVDENILESGTVDRILDLDPVIVGISSTSMFIDRCESYARELRARNCRALLVGGGVHFHLDPCFLVRDGVLDLSVCGEGEKPFTEFIDAVIDAGGKPQSTALSAIRGLNFLASGVMHTSCADLLDVGDMPDPDLDLFDANYYFKMRSHFNGFRYGRVAPAYTSRGCPFSCAFCYNERLGRKVRYISADRVIRLMKEYRDRFGVKYFNFGDDLFIGDRARLEAICRRIIDERLGFRWNCNGRVEAVKGMSDDLLRLMKKAGCGQMNFGFESGSDRILNLLKGPSASVDAAKQVLVRMHDHGIAAMGYFILGIPDETREEMQETRRFIEENRKLMKYWEVFIFTPVPGTRLWERCRDLGMLDGINFPDIARSMIGERIEDIRVFNQFLSAEEVLGMRLSLKQLLYRQLPMCDKVMWAIDQLRTDPKVVVRRIKSYIRDLPRGCGCEAAKSP